MFQIDPYPDFSWSMSRRSVFRECPRKYWYNYYGSHNGWLAESDDRTREIYRLKKLTSLPLLAGSLFHDAASRSLMNCRGGLQVPEADEIAWEVFNGLNQAFAESKDIRAWMMAPSRQTMLDSFYYGSGPSGDQIAGIKSRVQKCSEGLVKSRSFQEAVHSPRFEVKEADRFDSFDVRGIKVFALPDLLYSRGSKDFVIADWKTGGKDPAVRDQLLTYALYLLGQDYYDGQPVTGRVEYLLTGERKDYEFSENQLNDHEEFISNSVERMNEYLVDVEENIACDREGFPLRDDRKACSYCNFREICEYKSATVEGPFSI